MKVLNFPLSDYKYFKLEINDNLKLPINILKVGYYDYQSVSGSEVVFDLPVVTQKDSNHITYLHVHMPEKMYFEQLQLNVSGADFYQRYASIMVKKYRLTKRKKKEYYYETIGSFSLNSNSANKRFIGEQSLTDLYIEIDNKDDQPLKVEKVSGSFLKRYIIAELDPKGKYVLKCGNKQLYPAQYDLVNFRASIPSGSPTIHHSSIISMSQGEGKKNGEEGIFDNVYVIWLVIGVVGAVLGFISFKMIKELGERND